MKSAVTLDTHTVTDIEFQPASLDIWDAKYRLSAKDGEKIDQTLDDTYQRVAQALADVEVESKREHYFKEFVWALRSGRHSGRAHHFECRRPGAQAGDLDDQLHRVGYGWRLDGQHSEQGP